MYIAIINGPNLNLIGRREVSVYGNVSFDEHFQFLQTEFKNDLENLQYFQSNIEGEIVSAVQQHGLNKECAGIVLNAAAYSHTSIAIADAVVAIEVPVISVHISNIYAREQERHTDLLLSKCKGNISGLGLDSYRLAILALLNLTS